MKPELWGALALIFTIACAFVAANQRDNLKQQAVDKGYAEWRFLPNSKKVEFKWKDEL